MRVLSAALCAAALLTPQQIIIVKKPPAAGGGTIGYPSIGVSEPNWNNAIAVASKFAAPANGSNGTFFVYCVSTTASSVPVAVGVYSDSGGNAANRITAGTETVTCPGNGTGPAWVSTSITWAGITAGTNYWLAVQTTTSTNVKFYRDTGDPGQEQYDINTWAGALPATWGWDGTESFKISVYVTY